MKKLTSWLLVVVMLISCCAVMALPAAAADVPFTNLYNPDEAVAGRAVANMASTNTDELIYITSAPIEVKADETVYFGPLNVSQGYQAYFYAKNNTKAGTEIPAAQTPQAFVFDGAVRRTNADSKVTDRSKNVAVYSYTASADGYIRCTFPIEYAEFYVITKDTLTYEKYFAYFDNIEGANLWNMYLDVKGLLNPTGTFDYENNNHSATHLIAVKEGDVITWGPHRDTLYYGAVGYNAQGAGVTNEICVGTNANHPASTDVKKVESFTADNNPKDLDDTVNYSIYSYTVPAGVSYVRVITHNTGIADFMVQKNNEFNVEGYWELMGGDVNSPYFGKNSVWFGDSITQATQDISIFDKSSNGVPASTWYGGWVGRVSKALNMNYDHNGESGWSLSTARPGRIVNRLIATQADEPAGGFDVVMLHGGTNDAWQSMPVGAMSDSYSPTDFDINTYAGALEELFYYATTLYGDTAEINYILNYAQPRNPNGQVSNMAPHYAEALKICEKWGVRAIDLFHDEQVKEACNLNAAKIYRDGCHANQWGYNILTPFITEKMLADTNGNSWLEDHDDIAGKIYNDLKVAVSKSAHFTAESKVAFFEAATGTNNAEKLAAALEAAPALKQVEGKYIPITEMTKYAFAQQKDYGVATVQDLVWLSNYNNQNGNNNSQTVFGNLPGYIPADYKIHQLNDVDMNTDSYYNTNGYNTIGIGTTVNPFDSVYDGHGYKILNYKKTATASCTSAIFPRIKNATIKNLTIEGADITGYTKDNNWGGEWTGILAGVAYEANNLIQNCHVVNSTLSKNLKNGMGAILIQANNYNSANSPDGFHILDCSVSGCEFIITQDSGDNTNIGWVASRVTSSNHIVENTVTYNNTLTVSNAINVKAVGGIASEAKNDAKFINCGSYNNRINNESGATIDATMNSSLVGYVASGTINLTNCYADSNLPMVASGNTNIANCYSIPAGNITAEEITNGTLLSKLNETTNLRWVSTSIGDVSIPMVKANIVTLGGYTLYGATTDGKITASEDVLAAIAGKIWRKGNVTLLTKDILAGTYELDEAWVEADYLLGDCMGGKSLNTQDALALLQTVVGRDVEGYMAERADMNGDGKASIADVCTILRYIAEGINAAV
ncbi:MAG: hypothetical protein IJN80_04250 [Clostridia bacterium]|nr:hypothetical protein [Clostridia bacterium]